jgi:hypothetical protein
VIDEVIRLILELHTHSFRWNSLWCRDLGLGSIHLTPLPGLGERPAFGTQKVKPFANRLCCTTRRMFGGNSLWCRGFDLDFVQLTPLGLGWARERLLWLGCLKDTESALYGLPPNVIHRILAAVAST